MALCRILYAEDNKHYYRLLQGSLPSTEGVELIWVSTVKELHEKLKEASGPESPKFDLLLLDLNFKQESAGAHTFEKVVESYAIPTIILTSDSSPETTTRCYELGAKGVYSKETEPEEIATKIIDVIACYRLSFSERIKTGLLKAQVANKSAQTFAIGYTTAAINIMMISAVGYDFFLQMRNTGKFAPAEWELYVLGAVVGVKGFDSFSKALGCKKE